MSPEAIISPIGIEDKKGFAIKEAMMPGDWLILSGAIAVRFSRRIKKDNGRKSIKKKLKIIASEATPIKVISGRYETFLGFEDSVEDGVRTKDLGVRSGPSALQIGAYVFISETEQPVLRIEVQSASPFHGEIIPGNAPADIVRDHVRAEAKSLNKL